MRSPPHSPRANEAALDRALSLLPTPDLPGGLVARIVREVPRGAQLPPLEIAPEPVAALQSEPRAAGALRHGERLVLRSRRWLVGGASGLAALAAGVAAVMMVSPDDDAAAPPAALLAPAAQQAPVLAATMRTNPASSTRPAPGRPAAGASASGPQRLAAATPHGVASDTPGIGAGLAVRPVPSEAPAAENPAALPEVLAEGPVATVAAEPEDVTGPPALGARGTMGPTLPQGYGYSGGMGMPSGAPVTMSGGPGGGRGPR